MKKNNISLLLNSIIFLFIITSIIVFPENAYKSSLDGLNLWYNVVCPALLPFFICVEILISLGVVNFLGAIFQPFMSFLFNIPGEGAFVFIMSIASGYPVGAKIVANLRKENICTKIECQRMISLCSTSGPLFIIGAVSIGMLKNPSIASTLLFSHYLSAISIGLLMRFYKKNTNNLKNFCCSNPLTLIFEYKKKDSRPLGQIIVESVNNSINLILMIGGYIILFSVISNILQQTDIFSIITNSINLIFPSINTSSDICSVFFTGILEVTNGIKECIPLSISYTVKIALISFFIGFGGLSINAQVSGIIYDTDINFSIYFILKIIQGAIASFYSVLLIKFSLHIPVFNYYFSSVCKNLIWYNVLKFSLVFLVTSFIFLVLLSSIVKLLNKKFKLF